MLTDEQIEHAWDASYAAVPRYYSFARAIEAPLLKRIAQLEAARFAYASEFCLNEEGQPDKGSIHQNIRALKAKCAELERELETVRKDAERYRWLRVQDTDDGKFAVVEDIFWRGAGDCDPSFFCSAEDLDAAIDAEKGGK